MFFRPRRSATIRLLVIGAALPWFGAPVQPAMAQSRVAGPPEVTVDLEVLNSLGGEPRHHQVNLRPPRDTGKAAQPERRPNRAAAKKKPTPPAKKVVAKSGDPPVTADRQHAREDADRAARAEAVWEADRKRTEAGRQNEAARIKREEAERLREAKAEIEAASRTAQRKPAPTESAENIPNPEPGPTTPPPPAIPKVIIEPAPRTGQVAVATAMPSSPPLSSPSPSPPPSSPSPPAAPARAKPAAVEHDTGSQPHVDFAAGTAELTPGARTELDAIAKKLTAAEDMRVQLVAYATGSNDEANLARRLSLSRALNVRAYLIDHGVRNTRMDVRALGNRPDGAKPADRVDIQLLDK
jgi:outer membrane protein OmpA-like peptidoglycan-associated protein